MKKSRCRGRFCSKEGFTLIELLLVVLIIGLLAAVALPQYNKAVVKSKAARMQAVLDTVVNASDAYYLQHGSYPRNFTDLDIDLDLPTSTTRTCSTDLGTVVSKQDDGFEIMIYGGNDTTLADVNVIAAHFTDGPYKCRGFLRLQQWRNSNPDHKTYCMEGLRNVACGENCDWGIFCEKIMGKNYKNRAAGGQFSVFD